MPGPTPDHHPAACRLGSNGPVAPGLRPAGVRPQGWGSTEAGPPQGPQKFRRRLCCLWAPRFCTPVLPGALSTGVCGSVLTSRPGASLPHQTGCERCCCRPLPRLAARGRVQPWSQVLEAGAGVTATGASSEPGARSQCQAPLRGEPGQYPCGLSPCPVWLLVLQLPVGSGPGTSTLRPFAQGWVTSKSQKWS